MESRQAVLKRAVQVRVVTFLIKESKPHWLRKVTRDFHVTVTVEVHKPPRQALYLR